MEENIFDLFVKIGFDHDCPSLSFLIHVDDFCFVEGIYLFFDCRKSPIEFRFQRSHRNSLSSEKKVFEDIDFGFASEEFL